MKLIHMSSFLAAALIVSTCAAEDWPEYRGEAGDGESSESIAQKPWPADGPEAVWRVETNTGFSSFSVGGNRAFTLVADQGFETCLALDASTGDELWRVRFGSSDYEYGGGDAGARDNKGGDGPRSTPATDGERVYVYDAYLVLSCMDAANGELLWRHDIKSEFEGRNIKWNNATSPVLDEGKVYVAGGGVGQTYLAFDKLSGDLLWKNGDDKLTHATPRVATFDGRKQVVFLMQYGLVSVDAATGEEVWRTPFPFATSTAASPVVEGDYVYCSAGYGQGAGLFRVRGSSEPEEIWFKANELMNHWSTPIIHDGYLYGIYEFKKYGRAPLQCVDLMTGEIIWKEYGFGPGNCILVGDKLVVLSDAGELVVAKASPDGYEELGRATVLDGKCWSTPAFSDGRVFVRSTEQGGCFEVATNP